MSAAPQTTTIPASLAQGQGLPGPPPSTTHLQQAVLQGIDANRGKGSAVAYDSSRQEFKEYCQSVYPNSELTYIVNPYKVFLFMFYCSMREQKSRGGNHQRRVPGAARLVQFNRADYDAVIEKYRAWWDATTTTLAQEPPNPTNPVGIEKMTQYKAGVRAEWEHQVSMNTNSTSWDLIWTQQCKKIFENVKKRKGAVRRKNFCEKVSHEFSPYLAVERFPDMEKYMWEQGYNGHRFAFAWIRHRLCLLFTTSAILRCESLFKAELSDFLSVRFKSPKDVHAMHAIVMQIMKGEFLIDFLCSLNVRIF